jgi:hypothetical protein
MSRTQFERILRLWQKRLGLETWHLEVDWEKPASEDADASTWRSNNYDRAILYLDPAWVSWERDRGIEFVHRIVVHELLHLVFRDVDELVDSLDGQMHRDVCAMVDKRYHHEIEGLCDRLAYRLVGMVGT